MEGEGKEESRDRPKKLVERFESAGSGSEAEVFYELRNYLPGIGCDIITVQQVPCAYRINHNKLKNGGHRNF